MFRFMTLTRLLRSLSSQGAVDNVEAVMVERAAAMARLDYLALRYAATVEDTVAA